MAKIIESVGLAAVELTPEEVEGILDMTESAGGPLLGEAIAETGNALIEKTSKVWGPRRTSGAASWLNYRASRCARIGS